MELVDVGSEVGGGGRGLDGGGRGERGRRLRALVLLVEERVGEGSERRGGGGGRGAAARAVSTSARARGSPGPGRGGVRRRGCADERRHGVARVRRGDERERAQRVAAGGVLSVGRASDTAETNALSSSAASARAMASSSAAAMASVSRSDSLRRHLFTRSFSGSPPRARPAVPMALSLRCAYSGLARRDATRRQDIGGVGWEELAGRGVEWHGSQRSHWPVMSDRWRVGRRGVADGAARLFMQLLCFTLFFLVNFFSLFWENS